MSDVPHREALTAGEDLLLCGNAPAALSVFETLLVDNPDSVDALINLGVAALQVGDLQRGVDAHLKAFKINPLNETVRENLSQLITDAPTAAYVRSVLNLIEGAAPSDTVMGSSVRHANGSSDDDVEDDVTTYKSLMARLLPSHSNRLHGEQVRHSHTEVELDVPGARVSNQAEPPNHVSSPERPRNRLSSPEGPRHRVSSPEERPAGMSHREAADAAAGSESAPAMPTAPPAPTIIVKPPEDLQAGQPTGSDAPYTLSDYRVDKELQIVLKKDEIVRDYVALPQHLRRTDVAIALDTLVDYLQFSFQKVAATFFNTTRLSEGYVKSIQTILQRMQIEHGVPVLISAHSPADFVFQTYHFLKEHLPPREPTHHITIPAARKTLQQAAATEDVRALYEALRTGFEPLEKNKLISLFAVHGSLSTLDFTPFSDVDTQLFLTDAAFASPELLLEIARLITRNYVYLRTYDPLQHHGYFVATDLDRRAYPEPFLPVATLEQATRIFGEEEHSFAVRHVPYADRFAAWHMGHSFRLAYLSEQFPTTAFDLKRYMSRFALLPVLYLELVENVYPYKGDVFRHWDDHFSADQWRPFHLVTSARANWNPERLIQFSSSFHRQVFSFAELLLEKLNDAARHDDQIIRR